MNEEMYILYTRIVLKLIVNFIIISNNADKDFCFIQFLK